MLGRCFTVLRGLALLLAINMAGAPAIADSGPPVPEPSDLIGLVQRTIMAVADGNTRHDYSELHGMGSAAFKAGNSPDTLAKGFAGLRATGLDLSAVRTKIPLTTRPPTMDQNGRLRILGYYELPEFQVVYDVLYDYDVTAAQWQLAGISVKPRVLPPQPQLMQPE